MEAKSTMLDLLGWGVPSEYFINCGLTREAIYYAFTEMNLKWVKEVVATLHQLIPSSGYLATSTHKASFPMAHLRIMCRDLP